MSSETWRRELAATDRSDQWLALAIEHDAAGRHYQSNAALAAAQWLDLAEPLAARTAATAAGATGPGAIGWNARRALRALRLTTLAMQAS